jgi:hypothetical protein
LSISFFWIPWKGATGIRDERSDSSQPQNPSHKYTFRQIVNRCAPGTSAVDDWFRFIGFPATTAIEGTRMFAPKRLILTAFATGLLAATAACVTDPNTGERRVSRAAIGAVGGAVGGYLLGDLVGGRRDRTERIISTGIGALAGGAVGAYMDRQEQELRRQTAGTGVRIERRGDELVLTMPTGITFDFDRYDLQPQFRPTLDKVAEVLGEYPQRCCQSNANSSPPDALVAGA